MLCGTMGLLEEHHVFGGSNRNKSERLGLKATLCGEKCHRTGKRSAHNCRTTSDLLRTHFQFKYMVENMLPVSDFILEFGRNYIDPSLYESERSFPMNMCCFSGRLTRDPELRRTGTGKAVASFSLAIKRTGSADADPIYLDFVAWEQKAEFIAKHFHRGDPIEVCCTAQDRTWADRDGNKRKSIEFLVQTAFFAMTSKKEGGSDDSRPVGNPYASYTPGAAPSQPAYTPTGNPAGPSNFEMIEDEDNCQLPF